jgi:pyruvate-formate lyase-activating enzyme
MPAAMDFSPAVNNHMEILRQSTAGDYDLVFRLNSKSNQHELVLKYREAGKHFAVHQRVQMLDAAGRFMHMQQLDPEHFAELERNIQQFGPTEGLYLTHRDNEVRVAVPSRRKIDPSEVRHAKTLQESSFTATGEKLNHHWPIFKKLRDTGYGSIIRATMTNHQVCMSHCQYCSTIGRNKKDSVSLQEAKDFVEVLYYQQADYNRKFFPEYNELYREITGSDIRLKGLILSGGGQPNIWPHFEEFVDWLKDLDISLGLITNGFPRKVADEVYDHFDWIRISVTPENASPFYPQGRFNLQRIPANIQHNDGITLGLSYVYGPWTEDEILHRLEQAARDWGADYVRLLTDCNLSRDIQLRSHQALAERLFRLGLIAEDGTPTGHIFHQLKYHGTPEEADELWDQGQCHLQSFNVFWDTTGHEDQGWSSCYPCDSVTVLAEEITQDASDGQLPERKFNSDKWGTVANTQVAHLYTEPVRPYFDPRSQCSACLFVKNNHTAKNLAQRSSYDDIEINRAIQHVNFP